jgi:hypothetical protein
MRFAAEGHLAVGSSNICISSSGLYVSDQPLCVILT